MNIKNKKNKSSKKTATILALSLIVIIAGVATYVVLSRIDTSTTQKDATQSSSKNNSSDNASKDTDSSKTSDNEIIDHESEKDITPGYEGESPDLSENLTGSINYTGVSGDKLIVRTTINQSLSSGLCEISLVNGSATITRTSNIIPNPSSSSCEGFDIPTSELGSGNWEIMIKITSGDKSGVLKGTAKI